MFKSQDQDGPSPIMNLRGFECEIEVSPKFGEENDTSSDNTDLSGECESVGDEHKGVGANEQSKSVSNNSLQTGKKPLSSTENKGFHKMGT